MSRYDGGNTKALVYKTKQPRFLVLQCVLRDYENNGVLKS